MGEADALDDLDAAIAGAERIVAGIRADQWGLPTPCDGVDVRALVNHLVAGNLLFAALVVRSEPPARDGDHLGADPLGAFRDAAGRLRGALRTPGMAARTYPLPIGQVPGTALARIRITELLGHGWDLARATGQPADFPEDVAERGLTAARDQLRDRPAGPDAPFAPMAAIPDDAPAIDRLAAFLGRAA
jgi:uncharacterized protein (TIGR03086 family)